MCWTSWRDSDVRGLRDQRQGDGRSSRRCARVGADQACLYKTEGLAESTDGITDFDKLPLAAQEYLRFQERESGAKIGMVSTGPDREQTMVLPEFALGAGRDSQVN
jgi:adenylosuccinate synthase